MTLQFFFVRLFKIIAILNEVSFGHFYFEMAFLFRQSMLINSMLCNVEVLYGLNKSQIEALESVDRHFVRRVLFVYHSAIKSWNYGIYIYKAACAAVRIRKKSTKPLLRPGLRQVVVQLSRNSLKCVHRLYSVVQLGPI